MAKSFENFEGPICEPCSCDGCFVEAVSFCNDCVEYFCFACSKSHKNFKVFRNHTVVEINLEAQPGRPWGASIQPDSIALTWDPPPKLREGDYYQISYKDVRKDVKWRLHQSEPTTTSATVTRLKSNTIYIFRVKVVHKDGEEGPYSKVSEEIQTLHSLALKLTEVSTIVEKGNESPTIYAVPVSEVRHSRKKNIRHFEIGVATGFYDESKTILLVGATGTGKSVFVDSIVNYVLGVTWEDPFRFTVTDLEESETYRYMNQSCFYYIFRHCRRQIKCYTIYPKKGSRLNYQLTVIDTPGFCDTRGFERDREILMQIYELFRGPEGITFIDAVCFFVKAPDARLTSLQYYTFQSVMSLFGKDIENNITCVITFADGTDPPVLSALRESELPFGKSFLFNNSCLLAKNVDVHAAENLDFLFWEMGMNSFQAFFKYLDQLQTKSLHMTHNVILERIRLQALMRNLKECLDIGLKVASILQQENKIIHENKSLIDENMNFEYEVEETQQIKVPLPEGDHEIKCRNCIFRCNINCSCKQNGDNNMCRVMDSEGFCEVCPGKCSWEKHISNAYKYESVVVKVKRTRADMKAKYSGAAGKVLIHKEIVDKNKRKMSEVTQNIEDMIILIERCNQKLQKMALRPHVLTPRNYIDLLIEEEKLTRNQNLGKLILLERLKHRLELRSPFSLTFRDIFGRMTVLEEEPIEAEFQRISMRLRSCIPTFEL